MSVKLRPSDVEEILRCTLGNMLDLYGSTWDCKVYNSWIAAVFCKSPVTGDSMSAIHFHALEWMKRSVNDKVSFLSANVVRQIKEFDSALPLTDSGKEKLVGKAAWAGARDIHEEFPRAELNECYRLARRGALLESIAKRRAPESAYALTTTQPPR